MEAFAATEITPFGTLGNGTTGGFSFDPVPVNNLSEASFLASARNSVCAVGPQGQIRCWGRNNEGQLGIGNNVNQNSPSSPVFQINNGVSVDGGFEHFCALTAAGLVKCWGSNVNGQLGDGTLTNSNQPVQVPNLAQAIAVSAGGFSSCAMKADGSVVCWGSGLGSRDQFPVPVPVPGIAGGVSAKAVATGTHSCAIRANGAVACWGDNGPNGELLGNGTGPAQIPNPTTVNGLAGVTAVTVGIEHSCVLIADGTVKCWGRNSRGQIGNSTAVDQPLPAPVGLKDVVAIHAGSFHTCAVLVTGQVLCWGANESGQLAIQADTQDRRQPNLVLVTNAVSLGAGRAHTCVARADASVFCWGGGAFGQIGNGGVTAVNTIPQAVPSLANILALNAGVDHSCAVNASGVLRCWGRNDRGQTGNGVSGGNALTPG